jgi:DMSO/TMAO reductase YedYZ molybdopterin-dependent catalytic subunit
MKRKWLVSIILVVSIAALWASASAGFGHERTANLTVSGAVATPATYSLGQLQALPRTVFTVS